MWNTYTDTSAWRGVNDYQRAFERWQKAPQWRNDTKGEFERRKIERNSSKRKWSIRLLKENGGIACQYWNTDVVTFNPDGTITLRPWTSKTTDEFANALLPSGLRANFNNSKGCLVACDNGEAPGQRWWDRPMRVYDVGGCVEPTFERRADGQWWPTEGTEAQTGDIDVPYIVTKKARETLKRLDFTRFRQWIKAAALFNQSEQRAWHNYKLRDPELVPIYDDRSRWPELLNIRNFYPDADERDMVYGRPRWGSPKLTQAERSIRQAGRIIEAMRLALYKAHDCISTETLPYYTSWQHLRVVAEANRKLG